MLFMDPSVRSDTYIQQETAAVWCRRLLGNADDWSSRDNDINPVVLGVLSSFARHKSEMFPETHSEERINLMYGNRRPAQ